MNQAPQQLPAVADFVLTSRIPCAALAALMFSAVLLFSPEAAPASGAKMLPALFLLSILLLVLNLMTPALFALIFYGGGMGFSLQVAAIASVIAAGLAGFSITVGMLMLVMYGLMPMFAAYVLRKPRGVERSAWQLALGLGIAVTVALVAGAGEQNMTVYAFTDHMLAPFFDQMAAMKPAGVDENVYTEWVSRLRNTTVMIFPGFTALFCSLIWWGNIVLARSLALRYGFYTGNQQPVLHIRFGYPMGLAFCAVILTASWAENALGLLAVNVAVLLAGLLAIQGLAVAHSWCASRHLHLAAWLMYLMLLLQPVMILPFIMIGILDIWFDYRRIRLPASGGT